MFKPGEVLRDLNTNVKLRIKKLCPVVLNGKMCQWGSNLSFCIGGRNPYVL